MLCGGLSAGQAFTLSSARTNHSAALTSAMQAAEAPLRKSFSMPGCWTGESIETVMILFFMEIRRWQA